MEPKNTRGKDLSTAEFAKAHKVEFHPRMAYAYDAGYAIGRYLDGLKAGKLVGVHCRKCGRTLIPPRSFCEQCFVPLDTWVDLKDRGTVNTFSISYVRWDAARIKDPELPAVIDIEGASPGVGILHVLGEVDPKKIKMGMKVKAVWKPAKEREGKITDIKYFKPVRK